MPRRTFGPGLAAASLLAAATTAQAQVPDVSNLPRFQSNWQDVIKPGAGFWSAGVAQEFSNTAGPGGVTSVSPPATNLISNVRQVYGAQGPMTYFEILDGIRSVTFIGAYGDTFTSIAGGKATYVRASDWTRQAIIADPIALGWRYQSFAAWQTGLGMPTGSMGATSFGNETGWAGSTTVPQTGAASFTGMMGGIYNDSLGQDRAVTADVGIQMSFATHLAEFYTVNTTDRNGVALDELNIAGRFFGLPNYPQMFGSLQTARLQGTSSARFFGPAAEEFGGVFTLTPINGQGLERLSGAFGSRLGTPVPPAAAPFAQWNTALHSDGTIVVSGKAMGLTYDSTGTGIGNLGVTYGLDNVGDTTNVALSRKNGQFTSMSLSNRLYTIAFDVAAGDYFTEPTIDPRYIYATNEYAASRSGTKRALFADAEDLGWDYQSFGAWESTTASTPGFRGDASVVSVGAQTPGTALPTAGGATFQGKVGGVYAASYNERSFVLADMQFNANFADRNATFSTTAMRDAMSGRTFEGTGVNGWVAWLPGTNALGGQAATVDGRLSGAVQAQFYGPAAQEVGGIFALRSGSNVTGTAASALVGAFGARR